MLKNPWFRRLLMVAILFCIFYYAMHAPAWAAIGFAYTLAYAAYPESRAFHIATSKIVQYSIGYNFPKHGNPGDLFHKVDEDKVYRMDAAGEWVPR